MNVSADKKQTEDFMKKIFGIQAEFNLTADEEIVHGSYGYYKRDQTCGK